MKLIRLFAWLILFCCIGCSQSGKKETKVIGISQPSIDDAWREAMIRDMQIELSNYDDINLVVRNANSNNQQQIDQIRELMDQGVDVLIVSPFESEPLTDVVEEAHKRGIPTIVTDRKVNTDQYTSFIGADNYEIGYNAGIYAANHLPKKNPEIVEIWGLPSSSPAQERHKGFIDALHARGIYPVIDSIQGGWRADSAAIQLKTLVNPEHFDMVYSHNDVMAIAASDYFKANSKASKPIIIGIDAIAGAGLEAVADGRIDASFLYPTGGEEVVRNAKKILDGEPVEKDIKLETAQIDKKSAISSLIQNKRLTHYQNNIVKKKEQINQLTKRFSFLESSLSLILVLFLAVILLAVFVFFTNRKIHRNNRELLERNRREEEQSKKLIALNTEIEKATAQKLQFFTNISHEIRTPLTLIISPLEKLLKTIDDPRYRADLQLVQKNAQRLLREVNQMLDFRKIENEKMELHRRTLNLVSFVEDLKCYFDGVARTRHIAYTLEVTDNKPSILFNFDPNLLDKVLVNLLSNAFKFTSDNGTIQIRLEELADTVRILITDNGSGIPANEIPYIFERFYTNSPSSGTGIGLHLAYEVIQLHGGTIAAESKEKEFTRFTIELPKTNTEETAYQSDVLPYEVPSIEEVDIEEIVNQSYPYTVLIVEDDEEIREYLKRELSGVFRVETAANGQLALDVLNEKEASVIISDVMMPHMNGFELCAAIKNDINYSHLPFILLTALTTEKQRLYGTVSGADVYISKPFSIDFLKIQIIRLLTTQQKYHEQLLKKVVENASMPGISELPVENLEDLFLRKLVALLDEVYADSEYNVERLSDSMGMSRGHLYRKIKELTGETPVDFLRRYRLKKAAALLLKKQYSVSEICYMTGFSSPAYFTKCFKNAYGVPPSEFTGQQ